MSITVTYTLSEEEVKEVENLTEWIKKEADIWILAKVIESYNQNNNGEI